jgi:TonB family protein
MKSKIFYCLLLGLLLITSSYSLRAQSSHELGDGPVVTKAVAPVYPVIALQANAGGRVAIEVAIDDAGRVVSTRGIEGHKLLQRVSENAAKRWEFVANDKEKQRTATLRFIFRIARNDKEAETAFHPPYEIELNYNPPKLVQSTNYNSADKRKNR